MHKFKFFMSLILLSMAAGFIISCDKGTDSVGFDYYCDDSDNRIVHFIAKGKSDYGSFDYEWNFGDGTIGSGKDITHTFATFSKFTVILTASIDDSNIKTTVSKEIELKMPVITELDFDYFIDAKDSRIVHFTTNRNSDYGTLEYEWHFGDGSGDTGEKVSHNFASFGKYTIMLTAIIKDTNIKTTISKEIELKKPAITELDFDYYMNASDSRVVNFIVKDNNNYNNVEYEWNFGDGEVGTGKEVNHAFNTFNKYTVTLTASIKDSKVSATKSKEIDLNKPVIINVDYDYYMDAHNRLAVHFIAKGKTDYGNIEYKWNFGDGAVGSGKEITHTFGAFSIFTVTLTATIENSDVEMSIQKNITIEKPAITDLDFEVIPDKRNPRLYNFKATSKVDYGNVEYEWDFGDGMTSLGQNVQYGFEYFGIYEISLKAKISEYEKIETIRKKYVEITAPAITRLEIYAEQDNDNPFLYHFKPIAEATWGTLEYEWSFGDGKIAYDIEEPTNTYSKYASYEVRLKSKIKETGAERVETKTVTVQTPVFKNYEITHKIDNNDPLQVYFTIENKDGENSEDMSQQDSFIWEFGDGNTASGLRVNYRYESYGEKTVYVTLRTAHQTQKTLTKDIMLATPAIKDIKITGQPSMKAGNLIEYRVTAKSEFEDEIEYEWEFEDGTRKNGRAVEREMSYWQQPDNSGHITEKIYMRVKIPRLNISVRDTEPYEVRVLRPSIKNFNVICEQSNVQPKDFTCNVRDKDGKKPTSSAGGRIEYEWIFDGQTYTGSSQRLSVNDLNRDYHLFVTAKIEDTNISESISKILSLSDDMLGMDCSSPIVYSTEEEALKMTCNPIYNHNIHSNVRVQWDYGDGNLPTDESEHVYKKAGVYIVKMIFNSNQIANVKKEKKYAVLVKVVSSATVHKGGGRASVCGGSIYDDRAAKIWNNFDMFNQNDFTITNTFTGSGSCECSGLNGTNNTWYTNGDRVYGWCWGNLTQNVKTTICPKGFSAEYCISSD